MTQDILQSLGWLSPEGAMTVFWFTTINQRLKVGDLILRATQAIVADFPKVTKTRLQRGILKEEKNNVNKYVFRINLVAQ